MKYLILSVGFFLFSCTKSSTDIPCIPDDLDENVIMFYPFTDGSLMDESGNEHHLDNPTSASPAEDRHGNPNCAYSFTSQVDTQYLISQNKIDLLDYDELSMAVWVYRDTIPEDGDLNMILSNGDSPMRCPDEKGWVGLYTYDCLKCVFFRGAQVWEQNIVQTSNFCRPNVLDLGFTWNLIVGVKDKNTLRLYKDGVLEEEKPARTPCDAALNSTEEFFTYIGKEYEGKLDDIIVFDKALNQIDVLSLMDMDCCQ